MRDPYRFLSTLLATSLFTIGAARAAEIEESEFEALPPVPVEQLRARALQPSWDVGVLLGVCGVGNERPWQVTKFCLGGVVDALIGRKDENSHAFGVYGQLNTAGFRDVRTSLGVAAHLPVHQWLHLGVRVGGLASFSGQGAAPGAEGFLELGQRSFSFAQRYSLSHTLFTGVQWVAPAGKRSSGSTTLWLGLRFDGYWLSTPALIFQ